MSKKTVKIISMLFIIILIHVLIQPVFAIPGNYHGEDKGNDGLEPSITSDEQSSLSNQDEIPTENSGQHQKGEMNSSSNASNPYLYENYNIDQQEQNTHNKKQNRYQKGKQDSDGDFIDDLRERYQHRKMMMACSGNQTRILSEWMHENNTDAFELIFTIDDGPTIYFQYNPEKNNSKYDMEFDFSFQKLIEYLDSNANGRYDEFDKILSSYSLSNTSYEEITYSTVISDDNETISIAQTKSIDGQFSLVLYVTGNFSTLQNQILAPSEVKMDFIINHYDFTQNTSFLALEVELQSVHSVEIQSETFNEKQGFSKQEHELNISSLSHNCFFSWLEYAQIDNVTKEVNVSVYTTSSQTIINESTQLNKKTSIYFTYSQGDNILHDPKIGVVSISYQAYASSLLQEFSEEVNPIVFVGICITATLLFLGGIYLRKKTNP